MRLYWLRALMGWLIVGAAAACVAGELVAGWPNWRGVRHDGHADATPLVEAFPPEGPPVLWVRELGQGYSSFAVAEGKVYTQSQSLYEQALVCLDAETGRTLWSYAYGWPYDGGGLYPGPRATPTVADGLVYFAAPNGLVGCVTAKEGELVWSLNVVEKFAGKGTGFGYSASPLVIEDCVLLPVGGENASVMALDARDGSTVWKSGSRPASYATLLPIAWQDEPLVIALLQNSLACLHRTTGEVWWEMSLSHGYDEHSASPIYREPHLLVSGPFRGGAMLFELQADADSGRCKPVRVVDIPQLSNDVASSVLFDNTVYGFDLFEPQARLRRPSRGEFRAIDFLTGEVRWSAREPGHAQVIAADGKLVLFNDRGEVILARADREAYQELARTSVFPGEVSWTAPALANGRLFLRTHTRAACLYLGAAPLAAAKQAPATTQAIAARRSFDPALLIGSERDYPATTPDAEEFYRWWLWGAVATLVVGVACELLAALFGWNSKLAAGPFELARPATKELVACGLLLAAGAVGSAVWHRWRDEYLFTWPLALWAGFQLTVAWSWSVRQTKLWSAARGRSYVCGLVFFALCGLYFHLCRWLGLAIEWGFLTGLVWSFPLALIASLMARRTERWARCLWPLALCGSFSGYYGSTVAFLYYWLRLGE